MSKDETPANLKQAETLMKRHEALLTTMDTNDDKFNGVLSIAHRILQEEHFAADKSRIRWKKSQREEIRTAKRLLNSNEMEDMMQNQKPPSADYKVVKAQVQEQKFVQKLLNDRKGAVASLIKTGQEIAASADPAERRRIEGEVQALQNRYENLNQKYADRMDLLENAMEMAKEYI